MTKLTPIVTGECRGCCYCIMSCPVAAAGPINPRTVDQDKCIGCGKCITVCPSQGRTLVPAE